MTLHVASLFSGIGLLDLGFHRAGIPTRLLCEADPAARSHLAKARAALADPGCATCTEVGRKGCCAPLRCYCGHDTCHAFASWTPRPVLNVTDISKPKGKKGSAWANREESTWIDKM